MRIASKPPDLPHAREGSTSSAFVARPALRGFASKPPPGGRDAGASRAFRPSPRAPRQGGFAPLHTRALGQQTPPHGARFPSGAPLARHGRRRCATDSQRGFPSDRVCGTLCCAGLCFETSARLLLGRCTTSVSTLTPTLFPSTGSGQALARRGGKEKYGGHPRAPRHPDGSGLHTPSGA